MFYTGMYSFRIDPILSLFAALPAFDCQVVNLRLQHFLWYISHLYYLTIAYHSLS